MLIARTPVRISFGGGGTDLAAYYRRFGGMVVSAAINKYIYGIVTKNFDTTFQVISADYRSSVLALPADGGAHAYEKLELKLCQVIYERFAVRAPVNVFIASEVPPGTGLGSSSATSVTLCNIFSTLAGQAMSKRELAETAYQIETGPMEAPIGKQDQYAAAFGGLNCFQFNGDDTVTLTPLAITPASTRALERRLMLFYTGQTRQAREILHEQQAHSAGGRTVEALHHIKALGQQIAGALEAGRLDDFGALLDESWQHKKRLASGVSNAAIDGAYAAARAAGALGGKITGAGGGGFLMLYCSEDRQEDVRAALEGRGLQQVRFAFDFEGARVLLHTGTVGTPGAWGE